MLATVPGAPFGVGHRACWICFGARRIPSLPTKRAFTAALTERRRICRPSRRAFVARRRSANCKRARRLINRTMMGASCTPRRHATNASSSARRPERRQRSLWPQASMDSPVVARPRVRRRTGTATSQRPTGRVCPRSLLPTRPSPQAAISTAWPAPPGYCTRISTCMPHFWSSCSCYSQLTTPIARTARRSRSRRGPASRRGTARSFLSRRVSPMRRTCCTTTCTTR